MSVMLVFMTSLGAQNGIRLKQQTLVWYRGFLECELNSDWSVSLHLDERRYVFPDRKHQRLLPEILVTRKLNPKSRLSGGLWLFNIYAPGDPFESVAFNLREWRIYSSFTRLYPFKTGTLRWRLEAEWRRFLSPDAGNHFDGPVELEVYRQRFLVAYRLPLSQRWSLDLSEELFLNLASNRGGISFLDQNRISVRFDYQASKNLETRLGFLYWFQPTPQPMEYFSRSIVEVGVKYSFRLKPRSKD